MSAEVKAMDNKKVQQATVAQSKGSTAATREAKNFVADIKSEFSKISWTDAQELKLYTKMVIGATFVMGMGIYAIDLLIQRVLDSLSYIMQILFG